MIPVNILIGIFGKLYICTCINVYISLCIHITPLNLQKMHEFHEDFTAKEANHHCDSLAISTSESRLELGEWACVDEEVCAGRKMCFLSVLTACSAGRSLSVFGLKKGTFIFQMYLNLIILNGALVYSSSSMLTVILFFS